MKPKPQSYSITEDHRRMIAIIKSLAPGCENDSAALRWFIDKYFPQAIDELEALHELKNRMRETG